MQPGMDEKNKTKTLPAWLLMGCTLAVLLIFAYAPPPEGRPMPGVTEWQQGAGARKVAAGLLDLPETYGAYYSEYFHWRDWLIRASYSLRLNLLHESVFNDVLLGEDGWMFYTGEGNMDDYQRARTFTPQQVQAMRANLEEIQNDLTQRGIRFLVVIAPNKESIYPEYVPSSVRRTTGKARLDVWLEGMQGSPVPVLDLRPAMLAGKARTRVYYRTDTHWNTYGAYLAYLELLKPLQADFPQMQPLALEQFDQVEQQVSGDLARMLFTRPLIKETSLELLPKERWQAQSVSLDDNTMVTEIPGSDLPRAVVFRDSFFNSLTQYVSENFSRVVYRSDSQVDFDLIDQELPDVVILEVAERYLDRLEE
jgi:alginate O-acetyltransferase complex protein AlgJ